MKTDLKVELFLIHQTYFPDNHDNRTHTPDGRTKQMALEKQYKNELSVFH
jgi:hypothetical protein